MASNFDSSEPSHQTASDFENQNPSEVTSISACDQSELSHHRTFDFENSNPNEMSANSACNEGEPHHHMASHSENQSTSEICQLSSAQLEGEQIPSMVILSNFENRSTYDEGESSSQMTFDFGSQNLVKETDMSTFDEGERNAFTSTPSDFANQNHEKIDMSTPPNSHWSYLKTLLANNGAEYEFPEVRNNTPYRCSSIFLWLIRSETKIIAYFSMNLSADRSSVSARVSIRADNIL